jgi:hypothetical protein
MFLEQPPSYVHETLPHRHCPLTYLVSTVGVELNNENSTMAREKVNGERQVSDKRSENAVYAGDQSCQDVHNAIFLREKFVYKTHLAIGRIL